MSTSGASRPDGRDTRWDEHRLARRGELVEATLRAVRRHGATVGMDEIAAEAGTSKTVVYRHFGDKAGLYLAVVESVDRLVAGDLERALGAAQSPTQLARSDAMIRAAVDSYLSLVESDPEVYRFVVTHPLLDRPVGDDPVTGLTTRIGNQVADLIAAGLTGSGRDPAAAGALAHGVVGMVRAGRGPVAGRAGTVVPQRAHPPAQCPDRWRPERRPGPPGGPVTSTPLVNALRDSLGGRWAHVREHAREEFDAALLLPDPSLDIEAHRARVNEQMRMLADSPYARSGFPASAGGSDDVGASVTAFEMLGHTDLSLLVKAGVHWGLFGGAVANLGTARHHETVLPQIISLELPGCFAMTETGHGSDVQSLETTATYDPSTDELVVHTRRARRARTTSAGPPATPGWPWCSPSFTASARSLTSSTMSSFGRRACRMRRTRAWHSSRLLKYCVST